MDAAIAIKTLTDRIQQLEATVSTSHARIAELEKAVATLRLQGSTEAANQGKPSTPKTASIAPQKAPQPQAAPVTSSNISSGTLTNISSGEVELEGIFHGKSELKSYTSKEGTHRRYIEFKVQDRNQLHHCFAWDDDGLANRISVLYQEGAIVSVKGSWKKEGTYFCVAEIGVLGQVDLSDLIAQTDIEMDRVGWTKVQGRDYVKQTYQKSTRQRLDQNELQDFLLHLKSLPTAAIA